MDHEGSRRFRTVIECYKTQYQQSLTKFDKTSVTREIYDALCGVGSRFLKYHAALGMWEEVTPTAARDKIGHALRFANRSNRRAAASAPSPCVVSALVAASVTSAVSTTTTTEPAYAASAAIYQALETASRVTTAATAEPQTAQGAPCSQVLESVPRMSAAQDAILKNARSFLSQAVTAFDPSSKEASHQTQQQQKFQDSSTTAYSKSLLPESSCSSIFHTQLSSRNSSMSCSSGSFSLLDDIFPLDQQLLSGAAAATFPTVQTAGGAGGVPGEQLFPTTLASSAMACNVEFDFDAEILSVLI